MTTSPPSTLTAASSTPAKTGLRSSGALAWPGDHLLLLLAQAADAERHHVARLEEHRLGLDPEAHARRRAGADHVARQERHELADVRHDLRAVEDHRARVAGLHALAVDVEPHVER